MKTLEETIATAMDSTDIQIIPFLPYILQDFWEIGASPSNMITLIEKHTTNFPDLTILDLGCGKGAVSIRLAERFKCHCHGIDGIKEFIEEATEKAKEYKVQSLCTFETGDIREKIKELPAYDVIILGAIGPVFGNYHDTMTILASHLEPNGIIIIDDAYIDDNSNYQHPLVLKRSELIKQLQQAGMTLIDELTADDPEEVFEEYDKEFECIRQRCNELIEKHPEKAQLFKNYIENQRNEYNALEEEILSPTMVITRAEARI